MEDCSLGSPKNGFKYKFIEPEEHQTVLKILEKYLYGSLGPVGYIDECAADFNEIFIRMMERGNNLSYIAVDIETGEIAACRMVELVEKDKTPDFSFVQHPTTINKLKLCADICKDEDLYGKYGVTKYAEMFGLCTVEKYRQRGIATEMYRRGLDYLQANDFELVKCSFISPFTRRAGTKHGYKEFNRRYFHDCKDEEGNILNPNSDPTDFIDFGVFDLRNRDSGVGFLIGF